MSEKQRYNALLSQKLISEFEKRGFEGYYCETKEEACKQVLEMIPKEAVVSCGGSATLYETGIIEGLKNHPCRFLDPNGVADVAEKDKIAHQALGADYFLMGTNAITEDGELVNADGYGNRVSAMIFGPENVIVVSGMNKVEHNLDAAILRVKKFAARMILLKFKKDYVSFDELDAAAELASGQMVVTSMSSKKGRIKVILVGESLGY